MSTLNVANISDDQSTLSNSANPNDALNNTTTVDTKYVTNGCAKAWCRITETAEVQSSLNISTCTELGTGDREFNFFNSYDSTTSYTCNISSYYSSANATGAFFDTVNITSPSASSTICSHFERGGPVSVYMFFTSHGDLA